MCTASGTGYTVNEALAVSGSRSITPLASWVGYPSRCTWTANGAGGTSTFVHTMTTTASAGNVTYIHTDALGSPVARTNSAGSLISRTAYEPYGYTASGAEPTIGFTGHVNDGDTGLTYMQQRYYDPIAGRFVSVDPVVTDTDTGGSFNRYAYAGNSPYRYIDPDGRQPALAACAAGPVGCAAGIALTAATAWYGAKAVNDTRRALQSRSAPLKNESDAHQGEGSNDTNNDVKVTVAPGTSNPLEGEPGTCSTCNNSKGNRKQDRYYGPDGWPEKDVDYDHDHKDDSGKKGGKPHVHDWDRPPGGGRPTADNRGEARPPRPEEIRP